MVEHFHSAYTTATDVSQRERYCFLGQALLCLPRGRKHPLSDIVCKSALQTLSVFHLITTRQDLSVIPMVHSQQTTCLTRLCPPPVGAIMRKCEVQGLGSALTFQSTNVDPDRTTAMRYLSNKLFARGSIHKSNLSMTGEQIENWKL